MWFSHRDNPRVSLRDLQAALPVVRQAILFGRTGRLRVEEPENRTAVFWPRCGPVLPTAQDYAATEYLRPDLISNPALLKSI